MAKDQQGTYVYCVVAARRKPTVARASRRLPGTGPVRLLDVDRGIWLAVADAPLDRYGEDAINRRLSDLDWVSRAAVAHEAIIESFVDATAVLPMKLFTIFTSDDRARAHIRERRQRIDALIERVAEHHEWGVRVIMDRVRAVAKATTAVAGRRRAGAGRAGGVAYLAQKKAQRDVAVELSERARETVATVYDRLAGAARLAKRRTASELPIQGGPLLLDAAFLVPRSRSASFRSAVRREARVLARHGYGVTLTGPWPPYTFVQD